MSSTGSSDDWSQQLQVGVLLVLECENGYRVTIIGEREESGGSNEEIWKRFQRSSSSLVRKNETFVS